MRPTWLNFLPEFIRKKIEGRETLQKAMTYTGWMLGDRILRMAVGLLVGVWIARYLGPKFFGTFSYALAFAALFSPLAVLGLDSIAAREFVADPSRRNEVLGTSFLLVAIGGVTVLAAALGTIFLIRPHDALMHWLVGIAVAGAIFQAFDTIAWWFWSRYQYKSIFMAKTPAFLLIALAKIGLILLHAPLIDFIWAGLAEIVIGAAGLVITYQVSGSQLKAWRFKSATAIDLLKDSWPMTFAMAMTVIYLRIDQIMLGNMAGSVELGYYSVAVRLVEIWMFIPTAICAAVYPAVVEAGTISKELFYSHLQKLYRWMALTAYLVAVPVTFAAGWLVNMLYGTAYAKAAPLLGVLIWSLLFGNLGEARTVFLLSENWTKTYLASMVVGAVVNIVLNYFLIPLYGAMGAVIATCLSYWLAVHGVCFLFKPLHKTGWMMTKAMLYPKIW